MYDKELVELKELLNDKLQGNYWLDTFIDEIELAYLGRFIVFYKHRGLNFEYWKTYSESELGNLPKLSNRIIEDIKKTLLSYVVKEKENE